MTIIARTIIANVCRLFAFFLMATTMAGCNEGPATDAFDDAEPPVWILTDDSLELGTQDFFTFDIQHDYTPLDERVLSDTTCTDYVESTTFDGVVCIAYDGTKASVTVNEQNFPVATDGAHVTLTATKPVKVLLTGSTNNGSLKVVGDSKVCIALNGLTLMNPRGAAISCLSKKACYLVTDSVSTLSDDSITTDPVKPKATEKKSDKKSEKKNVKLSSKKKDKKSDKKKSDKKKSGKKKSDKKKKSDDKPKHDKKKDKKDDKKGKKAEQQKGTIFAEGKLSFGGQAPLTVISRHVDAIHSDKSIFVRRGTRLNVQAHGGDAIQAQKRVRIEGGMLNILSTSRGCSGIVADSIVEICGGRTIILSQTPGGKGKRNSRGIKSDSIISISDAIVRIKEESRGGKGMRSDHDIFISKAIVDVLTFGDDDKDTGSKNKGIKAVNEVRIDSARVRVRCKHGWNEALEGSHRISITGSLVETLAVDDAISVGDGDGELIINSGRVYAQGGMDAIDSNGTIHLNGGLIFAYTSGKGSRGFDCDDKEFCIAPEATVIGIGSQLSPPSQEQLKHTACYVPVPNATRRFLVTAAGSDDLVFGVDSLSFRFTDVDWSVLMSMPEFGEFNSIDVCRSGGVVSPVHTFHSLWLGGRVSDKKVFHTLTFDKTFMQLHGSHPYVPKSGKSSAKKAGSKKSNDSKGGSKKKNDKARNTDKKKGSGKKKLFGGGFLGNSSSGNNSSGSSTSSSSSSSTSSSTSSNSAPSVTVVPAPAE